jgi:hypothetical protein
MRHGVQEANAQRGEWFSNVSGAYPKPAVVKQGVGKYIASGDQEAVRFEIPSLLE